MVELSGEASPRVRLSTARRAPDRRNAYSSAPRSADSWPGRAITARSDATRGTSRIEVIAPWAGPTRMAGRWLQVTGGLWNAHAADVAARCRPRQAPVSESAAGRRAAGK